jgi:glycosyltransferase involved in cell wall biosynthesis
VRPISARAGAGREASVAYVLKAYPLLSETFISSEIYRVESAGIPLRIFVIKPRDEREHHPAVDRIRARPDYLPPTQRLSQTTRLRWLMDNVPQFVPDIVRTLRRRPRGVMQASAFALSESILARRSMWSWPKISYVRDLLLALALSNRILDRPEIRHLHAHFAHETTTIAWLASMITGLPFSFTAHAKDVYAHRMNPRGLLGRKLSAAAFVVTCTEANRRHLRNMANGTVVHRIYHGLNDDFSNFVRGPRPAVREHDDLRVIGVGRLVAKKGFDLLVDACGILQRHSVPIEAVIVGDDDDVGDGVRVGDVLRGRISKLGLEERVTMLGQMGQAELFRQYVGADVLCLPCRVLSNGDRDGIPNVLVEAMSCGVAVVSTPVSGIPELVQDGVNGLLVPENDPQALADALRRLHEDRELLGRLARAGRETVRERFDGDRLAAELASLFKQVVA